MADMAQIARRVHEIGRELDRAGIPPTVPPARGDRAVDEGLAGELALALRDRLCDLVDPCDCPQCRRDRGLIERARRGGLLP